MNRPLPNLHKKRLEAKRHAETEQYLIRSCELFLLPSPFLSVDDESGLQPTLQGWSFSLTRFYVSNTIAKIRTLSQASSSTLSRSGITPDDIAKVTCWVALPRSSLTRDTLEKEVQREAYKFVGLFHMGRMATLLEHHKVRTRDGLLIEGGTFYGDDLVLPPPDDACGRRDPGKQVRQAGVVHIRLPG